MRPAVTTFLGLALVAFGGPASAHPGHGGPGAGFLAGLGHPLLGVDHLLAMVTVGLWAAQIGGRARLLVPLSFVALMAVGGLAAFLGMQVPHVEAGIAASLMVLGLLVCLRWRAPALLAMSVVGAFALFHGAAHGAELPVYAKPLAFSLGFLLSTAGLHAAGVIAGSRWPAWGPQVARAGGALALVTGVCTAVLA